MLPQWVENFSRRQYPFVHEGFPITYPRPSNRSRPGNSRFCCLKAALVAVRSRGFATGGRRVDPIGGGGPACAAGCKRGVAVFSPWKRC